MALSGHPPGCDHWGQPTAMEIGEGGPRIAEPPQDPFPGPRARRVDSKELPHAQAQPGAVALPAAVADPRWRRGVS